MTLVVEDEAFVTFVLDPWGDEALYIAPAVAKEDAVGPLELGASEFGVIGVGLAESGPEANKEVEDRGSGPARGEDCTGERGEDGLVKADVSGGDCAELSVDGASLDVLRWWVMILLCSVIGVSGRSRPGVLLDAGEGPSLKLRGGSWNPDDWLRGGEDSPEACAGS
jgi:hypothetical protein